MTRFVSKKHVFLVVLALFSTHEKHLAETYTWTPEISIRVAAENGRRAATRSPRAQTLQCHSVTIVLNFEWARRLGLRFSSYNELMMNLWWTYVTAMFFKPGNFFENLKSSSLAGSATRIWYHDSVQHVARWHKEDRPLPRNFLSHPSQQTRNRQFSGSFFIFFSHKWLRPILFEMSCYMVSLYLSWVFNTHEISKKRKKARRLSRY